MIEGWKNSCATENIDLHSYVINIYSFNPIPLCVLQLHIVEIDNFETIIWNSMDHHLSTKQPSINYKCMTQNFTQIIVYKQLYYI
jgi:hypothetical protein